MRVFVALFLALVAALPALAEDERPIKALRGQIEAALRDHDVERASSLVDGVIADGERSTAVCAAVADAVLELFPHELGNPRAALLAGRVLADDKQRVALWKTVKDVRRRLLDDADVDNGAWLLERMQRVYGAPTPANSRALVRLDYDLAYLYLDGGRQMQAKATLEGIIEGHPEEYEARLKLAEILEDQGDADGTLEQYSRIIRSDEVTREVLQAHMLANRVLLDTKRDFAGAREGTALALDVAKALPPGAARERWVRVFEGEADNVEQTIARWEDVRALEDRVGRVLLGALGAWVLVLGGVVFGLNRLRARPIEQQ